MTNITKIKARWILDSRGNPTVEADVWAGDLMGRAAVPSGASTGENEALELRDQGTAFMGKHVLKAVSNINDMIAPELIGVDCTKQTKIDDIMLKLDGTKTKEKLGANAILAVSLACARLAAQVLGLPLYKYLYTVRKNTAKPREDYLMPVPMSNIINGGSHAGGDLAIQEFMILPVGAKSMSQAIQMITETYHHLKANLKKKFGASSINIGDEGGFAPELNTTRQALDIIEESIRSAGFEPREDIVLAMDAAASEFYDEKEKLYHCDGKKLTAEEMVNFYAQLVEDYQIASIEDPFDEKDFESFALLTKKVKGKCQIVNDDNTVTNIEFLKKAIKMGAGNSLLLKVNQIGSLTEALEAAKLSYRNQFTVVISHRSGETSDSFIADLAVALCSGFIKTGAPCRSDRTSKYNQLLRIEAELGENAQYPSSFEDYIKYI